MTTTPRLRGRAAIVKAWNDLPDAWRCHPALKQLHQAAQECEDAEPAAQQAPQGGELPPLPPPDNSYVIDGSDRFNADQMRAYARAALAQYPKAGDTKPVMWGFLWNDGSVVDLNHDTEAEARAAWPNMEDQGRVVPVFLSPAAAHKEGD